MIGGREATLEGTDYGVAFEGDAEGPWVYEAQDAAYAQRTARLAGGKLIARDVYVTDWYEVKS